MQVVAFWYGRGLGRFLGVCGNFLRGIWDFFSVGSLVATFFKPFKQSDYASNKTGLDKVIEDLVSGFTARLAGVIFRSGLILIGLICMTLGVVCAVVITTLYIALPLVVVLGWAVMYWYWRKVRDEDAIFDIFLVLPESPTTQQLLLAAADSESGKFLLQRFMLDATFLQALQSAPAAQSIATAKAGAGSDGVATVSGGELLLAIVKNTPNYERLLAERKLDFADLENGLKWSDAQIKKRLDARRKMHTGGVARDWSFGWTPTLSKYSRNISAEIATKGGRTMSLMLPSRREITDQIIRTFSSGGRQNVAIVGPDGAGKTSVVHDFAERLLDADSEIDKNLKFRQVFLLDSAALIAGAPNRGEIEGLMTRVLNEAAAAKNIILCLDDAQLFFEEGTGSVNIANLLLPVLENGGLRLILTINEQKLLAITKENPQLVQALNRLNIAPADAKETLAAVEDAASQSERVFGVFYTYLALKKAVELAERYIYDRAMPGKAISLVEAASNFAESSVADGAGRQARRGGIVFAADVEKAVEKMLGVSVAVAASAEDKDKLLNLEQHLAERMVGQERAVRAVSDALRRARAGVRATTRPVGTFMFMGPTGVGKTELAKSLAAVYYGNEANLVRVDMNQYVTAESVADLTADGADNPDSLTAGVMKKPFSVVLLDEIEKAHPLVLTALLQVLDEGVLRDTKGREVNFRDCILIATSNAPDLTAFRPEFVNRWDEIITFQPLNLEQLNKILDLMVGGVNKTLAAQKIRVEVAAEAKPLLVEAGYDPKMGARPMRRVVQKVVENAVAKAVLQGTTGAGQTVIITPEVVREYLGQT
ncbi:MAG: ATP-dependent Clp protease ATP-binding subunit [Candidatus Nomurabacteria bacterium]|jgi:ATP-dependent Clp protease ATP-binding subunit ClpC|nr:ATP-dependent Clp protease ATP-binding subunit [Candidatus Nomurabacteria bacterium]